MQGRSILFVDEDNASRKFARRVLTATNAEVIAPKSIEEAMDLLIERDFDLVFAEFKCRKILEAAAKINSRMHTVLIAQRPLDEIIDYLFKEKHIGNFLAKNMNKDQKATKVSQKIDASDLLLTTEKILQNDIFGITKYLKWGIEPVSYHIYDTSIREKYIEKVAEYCENLGCRDSLVKMVMSICDEFLMNAMFDAPLDKNGNHKYKELDRKQKLILEPQEAAKLKFASDGELLALSVEDPFGGINREKVISYLKKCFGKGEDQINAEGAGAGLGLYIIWKSVSQFIINVDPGVRTEFIGLINLSLSMKEFKKRIKSFHLFNTGTARTMAQGRG